MTYKITIDGTEITDALHPIYTLAAFPEVATCKFLIQDNDGSKSDTYTADDYMFKKIVIEEPLGTVVWRGRVNFIKPTLPYILVGGEGWEAQLRDKHIDYEPRVDLDDSTTELYEDTVASVDYSSNTVTGTNTNSNNPLSAGAYALVVTTASSQTRAHTIHAYTGATPPGRYTVPSGTYKNTHTSDGTYYSVVKSSTTGLITPYIDLFLHTTVTKSLISSVDLKIKTSTNVDATYYVKIYNWSTSSWDTQYSYTTAGPHDETTTGLSSNYVSDGGDVWIRVTSTAITTALTINVDFLEVTVNFSGAEQPTAFSANSISGSVISLADDITDASDINTNDTFSIVRTNMACAYGVITAHDYQRSFAFDTTNSKYLGKYSYLARNFENMTPFDIAKYYVEAATTPYLIVFTTDLDASNNILFKFLQYWEHSTTNTLDDDTPCKVETVYDGNKLINRIHIEGASGVDVTLENKTSQTLYQNVVKDQYIKDSNILNNPAARTMATNILARSSDLRGQLEVTYYGLPSWEIGDYIYVNRSVDVKLQGGYILVRKNRDYATNKTYLTLNSVANATQPYSFFEPVIKQQERIQRIEQQV